jgi:hypothetical protein
VPAESAESIEGQTDRLKSDPKSMMITSITCIRHLRRCIPVSLSLLSKRNTCRPLSN